MATIFLSYSLRDEKLAGQLELRLKRKGHAFLIGVGTAPAGQWRAKLMNALRRSDILVPLLSANGLGSPYVASEIGAGRVFGETRGMLLLPVVVGGVLQIPPFVSDYQCFHLPVDEPGAADAAAPLDTLADALDQAIKERAVARTPRIFVSHRHKDQAVAQALVNLIEGAFVIDKDDIRCTSVQPYTLAPGVRTSERLRGEIRGAEVVLGVLSPDTQESRYVLAELGASWGADVPTFPLLVRGAKYEDVPEPLSETHSVSLGAEESCMQLVDAIARVTSLSRRTDVTARVLRDARELAGVSRKGGIRKPNAARRVSRSPGKRLKRL